MTLDLRNNLFVTNAIQKDECKVINFIKAFYANTQTLYEVFGIRTECVELLETK